ncbi:MAG TPA: hypothetical protein VI248_18900 [Kineosporiaceae bacterium]
MSGTVVKPAPTGQSDATDQPPPPPRRQPRVRGRLVALALVPALALTAGGAVTLLRAGHGRQGAPGRLGSRAAHAFADLPTPVTTDLPPVSEAAYATDLAAADRANATGPGTDAAPGALKATTVSLKDVDATLARRTVALRARNEAAFLATFDASRAALIKTERTLFRNLVKLAPVAPVYHEVPAGGTATTLRTYVGLFYEFKGVDLEPTALGKLETWIRRNGKVVTTEVGSVPGHSTTRYAPLDEVPLTVRTGRLVTVVGAPDAVSDLADIDAAAERAATAVHAVWGPRPGPSRFIVFATHDSRAIGTWFGAGTAPIEAVGATMPELAVLHPERFAGARVILNLSDISSGQELYRVLRHEFTHAIDVRAQVTPVGNPDGYEPAWVEEGFAAWVEELDLPIDGSVYVHDLKALRSMWDRQFPTDSRDAFYTSAGDHVAYNYAVASMVYRYVDRTYGAAKAVAFYSWYAAGHRDAAERVLGVDADTFRNGWADWVESVIG